jgi:hypothetical protein
VAEHPSPLMLLLSSQVSKPRMKPSPHTAMQWLGVPLQVKPGST